MSISMAQVTAAACHTMYVTNSLAKLILLELIMLPV